MSLSQPAVVYPTTVSPHPSSHSKGSFGTVFIVLAVIIVISALACFLGRLCNSRSRSSHPKPRRDHEFQPRERDLEYGFKKGMPMPTTKPARNGEQSGNGEFREFRPAEGVGNKGETKPTENGDAKASTS
uniref:Uncharacterized protein n=1 Tax=Nelumbo nucifera TaxID=4432 RepID=A0A822YNR9_NELNU|nr:TPA_asm: hypothetical protein HUJ06_009779 [Nelumbo nucifera]